MAILLKAKEVTKVCAKAQHPSLNKASFDVAEGEFIGIMGASGSGKTTLLNVLSTIDTPTSWDIWINGVNIRKLGGTNPIVFANSVGTLIVSDSFYEQMRLNMTPETHLLSINGKALENNENLFAAMKEVLQDSPYLQGHTHRINEI